MRASHSKESRAVFARKQPRQIEWLQKPTHLVSRVGRQDRPTEGADSAKPEPLRIMDKQASESSMYSSFQFITSGMGYGPYDLLRSQYPRVGITCGVVTPRDEPERRYVEDAVSYSFTTERRVEHDDVAGSNCVGINRFHAQEFAGYKRRNHARFPVEEFSYFDYGVLVIGWCRLGWRHRRARSCAIADDWRE
jgi:hypothetical protein